MSKRIHIADDFSLPADEAATRSFGMLGMRGSGKSNAAVVLAEGMYHCGIHWVAIDPKGDWYGIQRAGTKPGLPVVIFGGEHGNVPLEPTHKAGVLVADLILNEGISGILDLSEFSKAGKIQFLAGPRREEGFAGRLFCKKKREQGPLHVFLEEAHDYVPQQAHGDVGKLIDVVSSLQTMGRTKGLGCSVLSQRSARVHKDVLTQVDTLIAFRTIAPQDREAIEKWVKYHGLSQELVASLPQLANGEAWLWSPEWLGEMKRLQFHQRTTYDSGSTPTAGSHRVPATVADIDLVAIQAQMKETIERAKADDPKELRKEIAQLKRELAAKPAAPVKTVEVPVLAPKELDRIEAWLVSFGERADAMLSATNRAQQELQGLRAVLVQLRTRPTTAYPPSRRQTAVPSPIGAAGNGAGSNGHARPTGDDKDLPIGERKTLTACAQYPAGCDRKQLSILTGYKRSSRDAYISRLLARGLVQVRDGMVEATHDGFAALGSDFEELPTGTALLDYWLNRLPEGEAKVLRILTRAGAPMEIARDEIDDVTGYRRSSRDAYLSRLAARQLVKVAGPGTVQASDQLFG